MSIKLDDERTKMLRDYCFELFKRNSEITEDELFKTINAKHIAEVYSFWEGDDEGDSFDLYTSVSPENTRYYLRHFNREWYGGWTRNEKSKWIELSPEDISALRKLKPDLPEIKCN